MRKSRFAFFLCCIAVGFLIAATSGHILWGAQKKEKVEQQYQERTKRLKEEEKVFRGTFRRLFDEQEYVSIVLENTAVGSVSEDRRPFFENVVAAKEIEERFFEQEELLGSARRLLQVNENDLVAKKYLEKAEALNKENLDAVKALEIESGECRWRHYLSFLAGSVYYRALVFINPEKEKGKARNLVKQALGHFERIFQCSQHDGDAQKAIELLYERYKTIAVKSDTKKLRLSLMPRRGVGQGTGNKKRKGGVH